MNRKARKSDSNKNDSNRNPKTRRRCTGGASSKDDANKQIGGKSRKGKTFVGMDLHKKFVRAAVLDDKGKVLQNNKVENSYESIKERFADMPCLQISSESSSVWHDNLA